MRSSDDQVSGARVRTLATDVMRRGHVRDLASVIVAAREREGVTRTAACVHSVRILTGPANNASGIGNVVIVFQRSNTGDRCVKIRGGIIEVRTRAIGRRAVNAITRFCPTFMDIDLSAFIGDRGGSYHAGALRLANADRRCILAFLRKGKVGGTLTLRTLRSNDGRLPFEKICRC